MTETAGLRVGLTLWGFDVGVRAAVDLAVQAEERGFDSVFLVEGVFSNDAITTVAGIATRTSRIGIGTGIANVFLRHPFMLGLAAAAIDEISGGRLVLGLGPNNEAMITRASPRGSPPPRWTAAMRWPSTSTSPTNGAAPLPSKMVVPVISVLSMAPSRRATIARWAEPLTPAAPTLM